VSALFADQSEFLEKPPFSTRSSETRSRTLRYPVVLVIVSETDDLALIQLVLEVNMKSL
jgi:hypothetical protein